MNFTRRALLGATPALGAVAALAACSGSGRQKGGSDTSFGPPRSIAWAVGTTGSDFVLEISLGAADAAQMLGWKFNRVLNPQPTPDAHINAIRQAVTMRSDVVLTVDWYQAVVDEIASGQKQGIHFAVVNSANNPETLGPLQVPFVGQEPRDTGRLMGQRIAQALSARQVTQGKVLVGNPFPGSLNVEERIAGIAEGLTSAGSALQVVVFDDNAAKDSATSVGLYKAKITEISDVVAHAVAGADMSAIPLSKALEEMGTAPGKVVVGGWASSLKVLSLVKSGVMDFALDENLYYQGFMAVLLAWSMLERGMAAVNMSSGHVWVDQHNVDQTIEGYNRRQSIAAAHGLA